MTTTPLLILSLLFIVSHWCITIIAQQQDELLHSQARLHLQQHSLRLRDEQQQLSSAAAAAAAAATRSASTSTHPIKPKIISTQDGKLYYNSIIYDFRPAFPPYSIEKLNELLMLTQEEQQQQQQEEEEEITEKNSLDTDGAKNNGKFGVDADIMAANEGKDAVDAADVHEEGASIDDDDDDGRNHETILPEERRRGEEATITATTSMAAAETATKFTNTVLTEDTSSSSHHDHHDELFIDDDNIVATDTGDADVVNDTNNDITASEADKITITSGTAQAIPEEAAAAEDSLAKVAAILDVQDILLEGKKERNYHDFSSADNDVMQEQQEIIVSDSKTEDSSSIPVTPALSDPDREDIKYSIILETDSVSTQVGEMNGETQSFSSVDGKQESTAVNKTIVIGKEEALLVSPEHISLDVANGDKQDHNRSAKRDAEILEEKGNNNEEDIVPEGEYIDLHKSQTIQSFSANEDESASNPSKSNNVDHKDANRQFVDGLDELDKLFEPVEVPDELDVGADGTSMQEVLVGQGLKILWKNVKRVLFSLGGDGGDRNVKHGNILSEEDSIIIRGDGDNSISFDSSMLDVKEKDHEGNQNYNNIPTRRRSTSGMDEKEAMNRRKRKRLFPITIKSPKTHKIWKYARRKFERVKHILGDLLSIFEGTGDDDDDDEFKLFDEMVLNTRQSVEASKVTAALLGGRTGGDGTGKDPVMAYDIDESFLKSRFEAMKTGTANGDAVE